MFEVVSVCRGGGYRYCRTSPPHPKRNAKGLYPLHRVLVENSIGRLLDRGEHVHHKNHDKSDDALGNLELLSASEHGRLHGTRERKTPDVVLSCEWCGVQFHVEGRNYKVHSRNPRRRFHCSRSCSAKHQHSRATQLGRGRTHNPLEQGSIPWPAIMQD